MRQGVAPHPSAETAELRQCHTQTCHMTDEHNGLTLMCPPDLLQSRCHPSQYLCSGFTVGYSPLELPVDYPPPQHFCGLPPNVGIGRCLRRADPDLDQLGQRHGVDAAALAQGGGGLSST